MATCLEVIIRAYQKAKILGVGEEPTADESADALIELQGLYENWAANGMFGRLADVATNDDYEANPNERIRITDGGTVTLPETVEDDGDDYPPFELAFIEVIDVDAETVTRHIYENGAWVEITNLVLADQAPLSGRSSAGLSACLALVLADEFGGQVGRTTVAQAVGFRTGLALKLGGDAARSAPDYF